MNHSEHFDKADQSYDIRFNDEGEVCHILSKDGESIIFPTAYDLFTYFYTRDTSIERFYVDETTLDKIYEDEQYGLFDYYKLKEKYN